MQRSFWFQELEEIVFRLAGFFALFCILCFIFFIYFIEFLLYYFVLFFLRAREVGGLVGRGGEGGGERGGDINCVCLSPSVVFWSWKEGKKIQQSRKKKRAVM